MGSMFPHVLGVQGEAGTGNVVEAVRHSRAVMGAVRALQTMDEDELYVYAKEIRAPSERSQPFPHCSLHAFSSAVRFPLCHQLCRQLRLKWCCALYASAALCLKLCPVPCAVELLKQTKHLGRLPVVNFAAGGVATPADAALMMQVGGMLLA